MFSPLVSFLLFFTLLLPYHTFSFQNYSSPSIGFKRSSYGINKKGVTVVFNPYTTALFHYKNVISYLKPQTPLLIYEEREDSPYVFIKTDLFEGFISKENIYFLTKENFDELLSYKRVLVKSPVRACGIFLPIGTKLPVIAVKKHSYKVLIYSDSPQEIWLSKRYVTEPLPLTKSNLVRLSKIFLKKPYVWGCSDIGWDCSGLLLDFFSFFNIHLPRNSYQQIQALRTLDVSKLSIKAKEKILRNSRPYLTFLYFPGHIMLYTGKRGKEFYSFQALNRVDKRKYGYVGLFPLKRTGLLSRVTHFGFIDTQKIFSKLPTSLYIKP